MIARFLTLVFFLCAPLAHAQEFGANDAPFLNLMGQLEGPAGFSDIYTQAPFFPVNPLETLTIDDVLSYQEDIRAAGTVSSAVSRYQFIHTTLQNLIVQHNVSRDLVFDAELQTYLARRLMQDCGFYNRETPVTALGNCLAQTWAALPMLSGPNVGLSAYDGLAGNKSLVDTATVQDVLEKRFSW